MRIYNLNIADLFQIMSLENSKQYLKYLRPGDRFLIEHINGGINTLTKNLNLTKALLISKINDGYTSSLVISFRSFTTSIYFWGLVPVTS